MKPLRTALAADAAGLLSPAVPEVSVAVAAPELSAPAGPQYGVHIPAGIYNQP